jgi:hypothetical protein
MPYWKSTKTEPPALEFGEHLPVEVQMKDPQSHVFQGEAFRRSGGIDFRCREDELIQPLTDFERWRRILPGGPLAWPPR